MSTLFFFDHFDFEDESAAFIPYIGNTNPATQKNVPEGSTHLVVYELLGSLFETFSNPGPRGTRNYNFLHIFFYSDQKILHISVIL
jgi:hypothetical protein